MLIALRVSVSNFCQDIELGNIHIFILMFLTRVYLLAFLAPALASIMYYIY